MRLFQPRACQCHILRPCGRVCLSRASGCLGGGLPGREARLRLRRGQRAGADLLDAGPAVAKDDAKLTAPLCLPRPPRPPQPQRRQLSAAPQTRSGEPMCTGSSLRSNLACAQVAPRAGTIAAGSSPRAAWDRPCRRRAAAVSKDGVSSAVLWASSTAGVSAGRSKVPGADENAPKSSRRSRR